MKKVMVVVGHSFYDKGAYNKEFDRHEYDCCMKVATRLFETESWKDIDLVLKSRNASYSNLPIEINEWNPDYIIELHLNSIGTKKVQGTEHLYYHTSKRSKAMADILQKNCLKEMRLNDRGLKPIKREDRGCNILLNTKAPCVITEPFFLSGIKEHDELEMLLFKYFIYLRDSIREIVDKNI